MYVFKSCFHFLCGEIFFFKLLIASWRVYMIASWRVYVVGSWRVFIASKSCMLEDWIQPVRTHVIEYMELYVLCIVSSRFMMQQKVQVIHICKNVLLQSSIHCKIWSSHFSVIKPGLKFEALHIRGSAICGKRMYTLLIYQLFWKRIAFPNNCKAIHILRFYICFKEKGLSSIQLIDLISLTPKVL